MSTLPPDHSGILFTHLNKGDPDAIVKPQAVGCLANMWRVTLAVITVRVAIIETVCQLILLALVRLFGCCFNARLIGEDATALKIQRACSTVFFQRPTLTARGQTLAVAPALMNHHTAAQVFPNASTRNTTLQGQKLGEANFTNVTTYLQNTLQEQMSKKKLDADPELKAIDADMKCALEIDHKLKMSTSNEFVKWMHAKIKALKVREHITMPGGWIGKPSHSMIIQLVREPGNSLAMKVCNIGPGSERNPHGVSGYRSLRIPTLVQEGIPLAKMTLNAPWECYFRLLNCLPEQAAYSANQFYNGFLEGIHPDFGGAQRELFQKQMEATMIDRGVARQVTEASVAQAWMAYMRVNISTKGRCKAILGPMRRRILEDYFIYLNNTRLFWPKGTDRPAKLTPQIVQERLSVLRFAAQCISRYARSVGNATKPENRWMTLEEGDAALKSIDLMQGLVEESIQQYKKVYREFPDEIALQGVDQSFIVIKSLNADLKVAEAEVKAAPLTSMAPAWPDLAAGPGAIHKYLEECFAKAKAGFAAGQLQATNSFCRSLFAGMPSVLDPRWALGQMPPPQKEHCMVLISELSTLLLQSRHGSAEPVCTRIDDVCHMQKAVPVLKRISMDLHDKELAACRLSTAGNALDGASSEWGEGDSPYARNGYMPLLSPKLDKELAESLGFLREQGAKSQGMFRQFSAQHPLTVVHYEGGDHFEQTMQEKLKKGEAATDEAVYVYKYLQDNPKIKQGIREDLTKRGLEAQRVLQQRQADGGHYLEDWPAKVAAWYPVPKEYAILAEALTDTTGKYLPAAFCALRRQAYVLRCFSADAPDNGRQYDMSFEVKFTAPSYAGGSPKISIILNAPIDQRRLDYNRRRNTAMASAHGEQAAKDQFLAKIYSNGFFNDTQNSLMLKSAGAERSHFLLGTKQDKSQQVLKTVIFYGSNLNLLDDPKEQFLFQALVFEPGLLRNQLRANPAFSKALIRFIKSGYERAKERSNIPSMLFFLRMGDAMGDYCRMEIHLEEQFPHLIRELEAQLKEGRLSEQNRSLVLREQLAAYGRMIPVPQAEIAQILQKTFTLRDYPIPRTVFDDPSVKEDFGAARHDRTTVPDNLALDDNIRTLQGALSDQLKQLPDAKRSEILSAVVGEAVKKQVDTEWDFSHHPLVVSREGEYKIDLSTGQFYVAGRTTARLPDQLLRSVIFEQLFPDVKALTQMRTKGDAEASFVDQNGYENRFICTGYAAWSFQRRVPKGQAGEWCDYYPQAYDTLHPKNTMAVTTTAWENPRTKEIIFLDKKTSEELYRYNPATRSLTCIAVGDRRNGLMLVEMKQKLPGFSQFQEFDPSAQFWKDRSGKITLVELPSQHLQLQVNYAGNKITEMRVLPPSEYENYRLSGKQQLPSLRRIPHYRVLESDRGERVALIPARAVHDASDLSKAIVMKESGLKEADLAFAPAFAYKVDRQGNLLGTDLAARLYYAYLLIAQQNYEAARVILNDQGSKLERYSEQEIKMLDMINEALLRSSEPKEQALWLKTWALRFTNWQNYGGAKPVIPKINIASYLQNLFAMPTYALPRQEELTLLFAMVREGRNWALEEEQNRALELILNRRIEELTSKEKVEASEAIVKYHVRTIPPEKSSPVDKWVERHGRRAHYQIDPRSLEGMNPEDLAEAEHWPTDRFLDLYALAKGPNSPMRQNYAFWIQWADTLPRNPNKPALEILRDVMARPNEYPESEAILKYLNGDSDQRQEILERLSKIAKNAPLRRGTARGQPPHSPEEISGGMLVPFYGMPAAAAEAPKAPFRPIQRARDVDALRYRPLFSQARLIPGGKEDLAGSVFAQKDKAAKAGLEQIQQELANVRQQMRTLATTSAQAGAKAKSAVAAPPPPPPRHPDAEVKGLYAAAGGRVPDLGDKESQAAGADFVMAANERTLKELEAQESAWLRQLYTLQDDSVDREATKVKSAAAGAGAVAAVALFQVADNKKKAAEHDRDQQLLIDQLQKVQAGIKSRVEGRVVTDLITGVTKVKEKGLARDLDISDAALKELEGSLESQLKHEQQILGMQRKRLVRLANTLPLDAEERLRKGLDRAGKIQKKLTMDDLFYFYVRGDANNLRSSALYTDIEDFLVRGTRRQQIQRSLDAIKKVREAGPGAVAKKGAVQDLFQQLTAKREYDPKHNPEFLVFEYKKNILMRKDQADDINSFLATGEKLTHKILKIIMGAGKSDVLIPLLALKKANGQNISIVVAPKAQATTLASNLQASSGSFFRQKANRINWKDISLSGLQNIIARLESIRVNREYLLVVDSEMHDFALEARLLERNYAQGKIHNAGDQLHAFRIILNKLKTQGDAIFEEVDALLNCRNETHIALDDTDELDPRYGQIATNMYNYALTDPEITSKVAFDFAKRNDSAVSKELEEKVKGGADFERKAAAAAPYAAVRGEPERKAGDAKPFTLHLYKTIVKPRLALLAYEQFLKEHPAIAADAALRKTIQAYIETETDVPVALPAAMDIKLKNELAFIRGELHLFLPTTLNNLYGEQYGFFPPEQVAGGGVLLKELPGPYSGADCPNLGSQFASYASQMNHAFQGYQTVGAPPKYVGREIERLQKEAQQEMDANQQGLLLQQTEAYKEYVKIFGEEIVKAYPNLLKLSGEAGDYAKIAALVSKKPATLNYFVCKFILPQIVLYNTRITSNAQSLPDMFWKRQGFSGTLAGGDTLHPSFEVTASQEVDGRTLSVLWKNRQDAVRVLASQEERPMELLKQLLTAAKTNAVIDAGALFKGVPQRALAEKILVERRDLKAVVYFEQNQMMIIKRNAAPVKYSADNDVQPHERFTLYDQLHCRGTDVRQAPTAEAVVTINKNITLTDLLQAVWRMRGLEKGQKVIFVLQPEMEQIIRQTLGLPAGKAIDSLDIIIFAARNQASQQSSDNLTALQQKLENTVAQACYKLLHEGDPARLPFDALRKELIELLLTKIDSSPYAQFGTVAQMKGAKEVLDFHRDQVLLKFEAWIESWKKVNGGRDPFGVNLKAEMDKIIAAALVRGQEHVDEDLPKTSSAGADAVVEVSVEMQLSIQQRQQQRQQMEQKLQLEVQERLQMEVAQKVAEVGLKPTQEDLGWITRDALFAETQVKEQLGGGTHPETFVELNSHGYGGGNIMTVAKVLVPEYRNMYSTFSDTEEHIKRNQEIMRNPLIRAFHPRIHLSDNFAMTERHGHQRADRVLFGRHQKPFGPCLLIQDKRTRAVQMVALSGAEAEKIKQLILLERRDWGSERSRAVNVALYDHSYPVDGGITLQGPEPIDMEALAKDPEVQFMFAQEKFLAGELFKYTDAELQMLHDWILGLSREGPLNRIPVIEMEKLFKQRFLRDSLVAKQYYKSPLYNKVFTPLFGGPEAAAKLRDR